MWSRRKTVRNCTRLFIQKGGIVNTGWLQCTRNWLACAFLLSDRFIFGSPTWICGNRAAISRHYLSDALQDWHFASVLDLTFFCVLVLTCTCVDIHPGRVEPASPIALTMPRTEAFQARRSCASSLDTFIQSFLRRVWLKTRGPEIGSRSALVVVAHVFSWPPVRHTAAWHAWTRTPPLNFVLTAVFWCGAVLVWCGNLDI